jgi:predicted secreted protein
MAEIELNARDIDRPIALRRGDHLTVTLEEYPSTGLSWAVQVSAPAVIAREHDTYERSGPLAPGAGGIRRFSFLAVEAGDATLSFKLAYPATGNVAQTLVFQISVS